MTSFHIHLVSDSTGETLEHVARACLVNLKNLMQRNMFGI